MQLIDGKQLSDAINDQTAAEIFALTGVNASLMRRPHLAIILVGERQDSAIYVRLKEKTAATVGIDTSVYRFPENISKQELIASIEFLNDDPETDGILLQLPLPDQFDTDKIINLIDPTKDVDGFTIANIAKLDLNTADKIVPPLLQVVIEMLLAINFDIFGRRILIVGNAEIFTDNLGKMLKLLGGKITFSNYHDRELINKMKISDLVITAVGEANYIKADMIKKDCVIIDIGISRDSDGKITGDADINEIKDKVGFITPVPGGVGPMTIATALRNTLECYKRKNISA